MTDEEKARAECMAEIMASPGKPYEVVTRSGTVASATAHGLGSKWPIVMVKEGRVIPLAANGLYWEDGDPHLDDIMGFAPKKPREWNMKVWTSDYWLEDANGVDIPPYYSLERREDEGLVVPLTITIREGHDD